MRRRRPEVTWGWFALWVCATMACDNVSTSTYDMTADITTNTCGAGLMAENPWTFELQFSQSSSTLSLTWSGVEESTLTAPYTLGSSASSTSTSNSTAGILDGESASFVAETTSSPDADPSCVLQRNDTIDVSFGGTGSPPSTLAGTVTFYFSPVSGYSCTDQLSSNGGSYDTLPCTLGYTMTGSPD